MSRAKRTIPIPVLVTVIGAFVAFFGIHRLYHNWAFALTRGDYQRATLIVHDVERRGASARGGSYLVARGSIEGVTGRLEVLNLNDFIDEWWLTEADEQRVREMFAPGTTIDVWHNPQAGRQFNFGYNRRVLPVVAFRDPAWWYAVRTSFMWLSVLAIGVGWLLRRRSQRQVD